MRNKIRSFAPVYLALNVKNAIAPLQDILFPFLPLGNYIIFRFLDLTDNTIQETLPFILINKIHKP
ncbi:hypothetical protein HUN01_07195 [Nostoc edaphicum CCNP1411]|uniref:Uncharacterized protein n=1 Tax=Nostoc edaphicum CCNP1411 TaxID=1472755 RepID=A0A7D7Q9G2_9NOSO|nr:hypothetical protein [Nostoc edaphicum]QMS87375.1 hypothetical protein HUN01_07195 [Nostoc edaphicum CCNP1411]